MKDTGIDLNMEIDKKEIMDNLTIEEALSQIKKIHLVGIGGAGMSGLALLLKERGYIVTGSDIKESTYLKKVKDCGVSITCGHCRENVKEAQLLCYSSVIKDDNVEIQEAYLRGIPVVKRGELLGALSKDKKVIAVSGSHGKTTTSALLTFLLTSCGYNPATFIGAQPMNYEKMAWWGNDMFVIEADESDGSFLFYSPWIAIVTNIDREHLDYYGDEFCLRANFALFINSAKELAIGWGDSPHLASLLGKVPSLTFGFGEHNFIRAENIIYKEKATFFDAVIGDKRYKKIKMPLLGNHNVLNVLAVVGVFCHISEDIDRVLSYLEQFKSTKRRFQIKEKVDGVTFIDDYAHHPTEIMATLKAAQMLNPSRIVVVFQPHRFSRAQLLGDEFAHSFSEAHSLVVTDIYAANEKKPEGFDEGAFRECIKNNFSGDYIYIPKSALKEEVPSILREGDLVICLGAGDIDAVSREIVREFKRSRSKI